jgi:hypothetical protein
MMSRCYFNWSRAGVQERGGSWEPKCATPPRRGSLGGCRVEMRVAKQMEVGDPCGAGSDLGVTNRSRTYSTEGYD